MMDEDEVIDLVGEETTCLRYSLSWIDRCGIGTDPSGLK